MGNNNTNQAANAAQTGAETRNFVSAAKLNQGQSIGGTVLALVDSPKYEGKTDLLMRDANGEEFLLYVAGTLKRSIEQGEIAVGQTIVITRNSDITTRNGRAMTAFTVKAVRAAASGNIGAVKAGSSKGALPRI